MPTMSTLILHFLVHTGHLRQAWPVEKMLIVQLNSELILNMIYPRGLKRKNIESEVQILHMHKILIMVKLLQY